MKRFWEVLVIIISVMVGCFGATVFADEVSIVISESIPELYIKAVNPGYTVDGKRDVGEIIEIGRKTSDADTPFLLAGIAVSYTNSSGNESVLLEFPENSFMTSETLLLSLASSPGSELAALTYTKTLAMKGGLKLVKDDTVLDEVCWTGKDGCLKDFKSANPTTLVRNLETGEFEHLTEYTPEIKPDSYYVEEVDAGFGAIRHCKGLEITEILSYYETSKTEQFIEIYNSGSEQVLMDGCAIRYKNKNYVLKGILRPEQYFAYYPIEFALTKNPTNANSLEIIDEDGTTVDKMFYPNGQRKGTAYAMIGYNERGEKIWKTTYAATPGEPNNYQEFKTCEEGKVINEATGNCVKVATVTEKTCPEGQYLSILTGRCRKIKTESVTTCKEGYYLNPETGRCKKIKENNGADYNLQPETYEEQSVFTALYAILIVIGVILIYVIYEFRKEIGKLLRKVFRQSR
ncbi:hypothetical protein IJG26_00010 [Candidatus Saccharibacteria bacterium]|nr:hypothetical protein [Candidatus Saccharibacteria bacterium]